MRTSKRTHFDYVRKTNRFMLLRELIGVNWVKHVIHGYNV
jgi:hypothetical protein